MLRSSSTSGPPVNTHKLAPRSREHSAMNPSSNHPSHSFAHPQGGSSSGVLIPYLQTAPLPRSSQPCQPASLGDYAAVIRPPRLGHRFFPNPAEFVGLNPLNHPALFAEAPWFDPQAGREDELINNYVVTGRLPDGLSLSFTYTDDWLAQSALPDLARARFGNEKMAQLRIRFTKLIYQRLRRSIGEVPLDKSYEFDT